MLNSLMNRLRQIKNRDDGVTALEYALLASLIATPLSAGFVTVLYFDLRVRKEAFDLQLLAGQIGLEPGEGASPAARFEERTPRREELDPDDQPPYWPPPPGWKPRSQREAEQQEEE